MVLSRKAVRPDSGRFLYLKSACFISQLFFNISSRLYVTSLPLRTIVNDCTLSALLILLIIASRKFPNGISVSSHSTMLSACFLPSSRFVFLFYLQCSIITVCAFPVLWIIKQIDRISVLFSKICSYPDIFITFMFSMTFVDA